MVKNLARKELLSRKNDQNRLCFSENGKLSGLAIEVTCTYICIELIMHLKKDFISNSTSFLNANNDNSVYSLRQTRVSKIQKKFPQNFIEVN